jgi:hypothetical protein
MREPLKLETKTAVESDWVQLEPTGLALDRYSLSILDYTAVVWWDEPCKCRRAAIGRGGDDIARLNIYEHAVDLNTLLGFVESVIVGHHRKSNS